MTKDISELVVKNAHQDWGTFIDASSVLQSACSFHCPHVVFTHGNGAPVGWFMQHVILGSLNYLHVQPEYRGQGLGKKLVSILSKEVLDRDGVSFIHVSPDNKVSVKIHEDLGYVDVGAFSFSIMLPE
ncbi:hypothetical protein FSP39_018784 [Pinctada imbricata]|uniref:N-acetyltransferase domain-containing protein n=1 Tax=Pinctada imbricata TaxID=66713 RepID=A0AA88Y8Y6_PINIB|nr:hypothetical protein FSP39_018784 [Pinctada imbricata]